LSEEKDLWDEVSFGFEVVKLMERGQFRGHLFKL